MSEATKSPPRCVRTATIHVGLVAVPVKLYTSVESSDSIHFNMLHEADGARLKQQYVCTKCEKVVDRNDMVKGYEHAKGQYVVFTSAELEALEALATNEVKVSEFVPAGAVDPTYVEKTYYLGPDKGAEKAYRLLVDALQATDRVAIATYARSGEERLVMVRNITGHVLALHELRYAREVKRADTVPHTIGMSDEKNLKLAKQLIERMSSDGFLPERYADTLQVRQLALINAKIEGGEIVVAPTPAGEPMADLIAALRASLEQAPAKKKVTAPKRARAERVASVAKKRKAS